MTAVPEATVLLGEHDPTHIEECGCGDNQVLETEYALDAFCIETHPFPGEGLPLPTREGHGTLAYGDVLDVDRILTRYGRRLCTFAEVLYASAGDANRRFPWGDEYEDRCEPDHRHPTGLIGGYPACVTPEGVVDLGVRASWARLDPVSRRWFEDQFDVSVAPGELVVTGAHDPDELPFFAPNNYGVHAHVHAGGLFDVGRFPGIEWMDDGLRTCADFGTTLAPGVEDDWDAVRVAFGEHQTYDLLWAAGPPAGAGTFRATAIGAGRHHTCAVDEDGEARCWGDDGHGRLDALPGPFTAIDGGRHHTCALRVDGSVACWGSDAQGQCDPPEGPFVELTVGELHSCARREDGTVACWGTDESDQLAVPEGERFSTISAGRWETCGEAIDGDMVCWGGTEWPIAVAPPSAEVVEIASGEVHHCAGDDGGSVVCWGDNDLSSAQPPFPDGWSGLVAGALHTCGLRAAGRATCWGETPAGLDSPPDVDFRALAAGAVHTCGLDVDGIVTCWGGNAAGQASPP